ncbi:MAG: hypothetical protein H6713_42895 [Myxococcales bacterium]|nr:hypothetical protein [Myxococcales bacterium]
MWENVLPLPTAADVSGDLVNNWGMTPEEFRPLFMLMEEVSTIVGSGRIFSVIAYGESRWVPTAQNGDGDTDRDKRERAGSKRAWENYKGRNPELKFGQQAADFGSGGLFGALAPFFLWTGVIPLRSKAPLLNSDPRIMFLPRVAGFGACVYMQRLLDNYQIDNHADIKVGWASPSWLKSGRGGDNYNTVQKKFKRHAGEVGIDLNDESTIPAKLSTENWPGVMSVLEQLVGTLPTLRGGA